MDHKIHSLTNELPRWIAMFIVVIVILRVIILAVTIDTTNIVERHYFIRQSVYTLVWGVLAVWFTYYFLHANDLLPENMNLEKISLLSMSACIFKAVMTTAHFFPIISSNILMSLYNVAELIVWVVLALFFWGYSRHQHRIFAGQRKK